MRLAPLLLTLMPPFLGACSTPAKPIVLSSGPTYQEVEMAPIGDPPALDLAISTAKPAILERLKDPDSAQMSWGSQFKRSSYPIPYFSDDARFGIGWALQVDVNAKNSFGGYTGKQPWVAMFRNGELVAIGAQGGPAYDVLRQAERMDAAHPPPLSVMEHQLAVLRVLQEHPMFLMSFSELSKPAAASQ